MPRFRRRSDVVLPKGRGTDHLERVTLSLHGCDSIAWARSLARRRPREKPSHGRPHDTIRIDRSYPVPPAEVFRAWAEPAARERWFVREDGWESEYSQDFRVGGREEGWFRQSGGERYVNRTQFQDIVPDARIVFAYTMARDATPISASLATVELVPEGGGTRLRFTEQLALLDGGDTAAEREAGWRGLLDRLGDELGSS